MEPWVYVAGQHWGPLQWSFRVLFACCDYRIVKPCNRKPRLECVNARHPPSKILVDVLPWTGRKRRKWLSRQTGRQSNHHKYLVFRKMMRSLKHYLRTQSQGHHTIDRLEERGVERGSARRSSLKGRERAIVSQTNIGTVSKATLGTLLRDGVERIRASPSA